MYRVESSNPLISKISEESTTDPETVLRVLNSIGLEDAIQLGMARKDVDGEEPSLESLRISVSVAGYNVAR